ncbi:MAG: RNA-binding S4 domain-containing protein [Parvularculaceae bacterium]
MNDRAVTAPVDAPAGDAAQRIDKWLWCARFFKTRSLAAKFVVEGGVRVTRGGDTTRIGKPSFLVRPRDAVSFAVGARLFVVEVERCASRRGPAPEARTLYVDRSPPAEPRPAARRPPSSGRAPGAGRPTKKDRRALDAWREELSETREDV